MTFLSSLTDAIISLTLIRTLSSQTACFLRFSGDCITVAYCLDQLHSLSELQSPCRGDLLGQRWGGPLQDEGHSGSHPHSLPGLYWTRSGTSPEWFPSGPGVVGSWGSHQVLLAHLVYDFPFCKILATTFWWLFPQSPRKLGLYSPPVIWEHLSLMPNYSWDVPHSFPYSKLPFFFCCELPFYGKVFWRLIIDCLFIVESNWWFTVLTLGNKE